MKAVTFAESWIIPAYAGSTPASMAMELTVLGSSPHTRGARSGLSRLQTSVGDHPRIRGEHRRIRRCRPSRRWIIPAYAGSTVTNVAPRVGQVGSSPHTRGAPPRVPPLRHRRRDHPRIRGEHWASTSSGLIRSRIIPAYAGSTSRSPRSSRRLAGSSPHTRGAPLRPSRPRPPRRDHPRIRGEHPPTGPQRPRIPRIIPAYAGSTRQWMPAPASRWGSSPHTRGAPSTWRTPSRPEGDHPRIRGEH